MGNILSKLCALRDVVRPPLLSYLVLVAPVPQFKSKVRLLPFMTTSISDIYYIHIFACGIDSPVAAVVAHVRSSGGPRTNIQLKFHGVIVN